ncbi:TetR/AcrR family transcriptional regulator [Bacillus sp. EB600]|uniref:TetR/AcrR family transcriptional regulator n=1 Tax=Bacillus sp. EB600 TaxID=2806345 RepID=UPI00210EA6B7|nr:TetR/AcrR family transcriptional regulator [Bacillus sp. EB600]MCQ6279323.1 TetR/AcrR family transcriptional regulator [Bacillus sp. EB600]
MDTKSMIIDNATTLFQKKGYKGVGLNEILKVCKITKGSLYHHFPNGKEELLIACLRLMNETIKTKMAGIFHKYPSTQTATVATIELMLDDFERDGMITGYTFSSIVYEMASLSEPVRNACADSFSKIQMIVSNKLVEDGFSKESADSIALMVTASIEGGILLCLAQKSSDPLKIVSKGLPNLLKEF